MALLALCGPPCPLAAQAEGGPSGADHARAVGCLALAVAYESGFEPVEGQQAVAEVILNRLRDPRFPKTVCDVVFAGSQRRTGCQFSFTCDGALRRRLPGSVLAAARSVAEDALAGRTPPHVPGATHYHADYVQPYWAPGLTRRGRIGAHIFYAAPAHGGALAALDRRAAPAAVALGTAPAPGFLPWGLTLTAPR